MIQVTYNDLEAELQRLREAITMLANCLEFGRDFTQADSAKLRQLLSPLIKTDSDREGAVS